MSLYDALIIVGHVEDQLLADDLVRGLADLGYRAGSVIDPHPAGASTSLQEDLIATDNILVLATTRDLSARASQAIRQAAAYHKRLFLIHPIESPGEPTRAVHPPQGPSSARPPALDLIQQAQAMGAEPWCVSIHLRVGPRGTDLDLRELVAAFQHQQSQVHLHTQLLVQALSWQSHQRSSADLLTGANLDQALQWLVAGSETSPPRCSPTPLQCEWIAASARQADYPRVQVMLAYADEDKTLPLGSEGTSIIDGIRQLLLRSGVTLWDRQFDYQPGDDLEAAISRATEACDNYVIVLSPQAMQNASCLQGLLFALSMNKRIVPVLLNTVETQSLPDPLQTLAWVDLRGAKPPLGESAAGRQLVQTLRHEADYHRTHTQLLLAALNWERQQRHPDSLLPKADLAFYQRWLTTARQHPHYPPIYLQELFISQHRHQASPTRRDWPKSPWQGMTQVTASLHQWLSR